MSSRTARITLLLLVGVGSLTLAAEEAGVDELFDRARGMALDGRREEARALCREILERSPKHVDARVLLGRLHAWDKEYAVARETLQQVLDERPGYADARNALIDVELWSDRPEAALELAETGLASDPGNVEHQERRARALAKLGRDAEALEAARLANQADPARPAARRLYRRLLDEGLRNKVSADYSYENFDDRTDSWHEMSLAYRRSNGWGSLLGRVNRARRFDKDGTQFEVDAYPKILRKTYAYLNVGYSSTDLFPDWRYSAELYHNFRHGYEGSLGFRRLEFDESDVTIYTGTVARYVGDYWISLRPNWVDHDVGDSSLSAGLSVRRYFSGRYEYAEITVGGGSENEQDLITEEEDRLDSSKIRLELHRRVAHRVILKGVAGYRSQDLDVDRKRDSYFFGIGVEKYF